MKKLTAFLVVISLLCVFFAGGCKKTSTTVNTSELKSETDANLRFIRPGHDPDKADDPYNIAMKEYEQKYNAKVDVVQSTYDTWQQLFDTNMQAGNPIDVVTQAVYYYAYLTLGHRTQPLNNIIDVNDKNLSKEAMDMFYSYNGQYYSACSSVGIYPAVLYYNKDMIENAGLDDPLQLYKDGKWNWDTFEEMCKTLTVKNDDGTMKQYALSMWYPNLFLAMNHTSAVKFENNRYVLNFDDPALKTALAYSKEFYFDAKYRGVFGNDIFESWFEGKNAFLCEYSYTLDDKVIPAKEQGTFTFDYGVVGMPYGPDNTEKYNPCHSDSVAIAAGSHAPYHAGQYIMMAMQAINDQDKASSSKRPADAVALIKELQQKPFASPYTDSVVDSANALMDSVDGGKSPDEALSSMKNAYQSYVDDANDEAANAESGTTTTEG